MSDTDHPTADSHKWNLLRDGSEGPLLCHLCGGSGYPKIGAAERCQCTATEQEADQ